jgi:hypothetical protein
MYSYKQMSDGLNSLKKMTFAVGLRYDGGVFYAPTANVTDAASRLAAFE